MGAVITKRGEAESVGWTQETGQGWARRLSSLFEKSSRLQLPSARRAADMLAPVEELLHEAATILAQVAEEDGESPLADLSAVARADLLAKGRRLREPALATNPDLWLEEAHGLVGRVGRTAIMVESALCTRAGTEARLSVAHQTGPSLRVRREYARLRALLRPPPVDAPARLKRLRLVGTRLAMLLGGPHAPILRPADRAGLASVQGRILSCLRQEGSATQAADAQRLWHDLVGFGSFLADVSRRAELQLHDAEQRRLLREAMRSGDRSRLTAHVRDHARGLVGLHDALDDALLGAQVSEDALVRACELACAPAGRHQPS